MSFTKILAKPDETLEQHANYAVNFFKKLAGWQSKQIEDVSEILNINQEELRARLFATIYLHDIGKLSEEFQSYIRDRRAKAYPHGLLSIPFIYAAVPQLSIDGQNVPFETIAVMSHHTPYYDDLYSSYRDDHLEKRYLLKEAEDFYYRLPEIYLRETGREFPFALQQPRVSILAGELLDKIKDTVKNSSKKVRQIHAMFVAALHYCDWLASGHQDNYEYSATSISEKLLHYIKARVRKFDDWYEFQKNANKMTGNLFLKAPTGKGKTEASLLWAENNLLGGKILYFLPTRVTVNAMYARLTDIFGENVGISHGSSAVIIAENERWDKAKRSSKRLMAETFMQPVTVATVDQLLLSLFNWRHWEMLMQNASNATIIFDEIHSYDHYTLALITESVRMLSKSGSRFFFSSATLPSYVEEHFRHLLKNNIATLSDKEYNSIRHSIVWINQRIENSLDDIIENFKRGKKVLVILNTVKKAIEMYRLVKERLSDSLNANGLIVLYHSRFIEKDRRDKEKFIQIGANLQRGFIAITTQVVEVSLDIDYDVLFTQITPIDALVQRLGRVNRQGRKGIDQPNVFVYDFGDSDHKIYGEDNLQTAKTLVESELHNKQLAESEIPGLMEKQYPKDTTLGKLKEEVEKVRADLQRFLNELWQIQSFLLGDRLRVLYNIARTREARFPDIEAIPSCFMQDVEKLEHKLEVVNFLVRLPLVSFHKSLSRPEGTHFTFADVEYSWEEGVTSPKEGNNIIE